MRIRGITASVVLVLLLSFSYAPVTNINGKNEDGSPLWTTEMPLSNKHIYCVVSA